MSDPGIESAENAVYIAFFFAAIGFAGTILTDSLEPFFIFCTLGIIICLAKIYSAESESKRYLEKKARKAETDRINREKREIKKEQMRILQLKKEAETKEKNLDYKGAIEIWDYLGEHSEAKRIRIKMQKSKRVKVDQTVVHGDYIDDRDTVVKDSVINRSNIGDAGEDKIAKLEKIADMKDKGIINDDEFKQMKKEILG